MKKVILLIFLFHFSETAFTQNGWNAYIAGISTSFLAGLESSISIDKYGNKWIGFTNSLATSAAAVAKYNTTGGFWTYYSSSNTPAFASNKVNTIACDTLGNVWIGTLAGLVKYDGITFTNYTIANGLPDNNILALECKGNMVYIGTTGGLTRYNGSLFSNYNVSNSLLCNDTITAIKAQTPTQIWLGTQGKLIEMNFNSTFTFSSYNLNTIPFSCGKTNSIFVDNLGKKWLGTSTKGLIEFDNTNFSLASNTYSTVIGAYLPVNCLDIARGPNNGALFYTTCGPYNTPSGSSISCLLELLPDKKYKVYYVPNSNYALGDYLETDLSNTIYTTHKLFYGSGGVLKFMFSLQNTIYNPFMQGPGGGVNNSNFKYLDINGVKAGIANRGDMFWDIGQKQNASYEVPKGSGTHSGFAKCLWVGGLDASNQLHIAAQTYRQNGNDFWPGPLDTVNVTSDTSTFINYDRIWKISYNDINDFIVNFQNGNIANNTYTPTIDIITWPAKGSGNHSRNMAPYIDVNNNGVYDPLIGGDYPQIKGDQTLYFVFNDKFSAHSETWGAPLGIEVHAMAYAYGCPNFINGKNELAYTTFYNYKVYNRSNNNYHNVKIGLYDDVDLGNYADDYIGCHVAGNLGFSYNGDGFDETSGGVNGYQNYPPAIGTCVLKGPLAPINDGIDNNNNGIIDEVNEECLMNQFGTYSNGFGSSYPLGASIPSTANQHFNYLNAMWKDSTDFTCNGTGYGGTTPTKFLFPWTFYSGMPCTMWADGTIPKGDRKHIISIGPFNLNAKQNTEFEYAQVWAVDSSSSGNNIGAVTKLINTAQYVSNFYQTTTQSTCLPNMAIGIKENISKEIEFTVYPNPAHNYVQIQTATAEVYAIEITNILGQRIYSVKPSESDKATIDISNFGSGIYFISLNKGNVLTVKKFVKD